MFYFLICEKLTKSISSINCTTKHILILHNYLKIVVIDWQKEYSQLELEYIKISESNNHYKELYEKEKTRFEALQIEHEKLEMKLGITEVDEEDDVDIDVNNDNNNS